MASFKAFGLTCPEGGVFHVCDKAAVPFIGCCTSDPCANDGKCPTANLRTSSFSNDTYLSLPEQDCDDAQDRGRNIWYTCSFNKPPFMGCCDVNPCQKGSCPREKLVPAKLSEKEINRNLFLNPTGSSASSTSSTPSATSSSTPSTTSSSMTAGATAERNTAGTEQQSSSSGLSTGAIVGIGVGVGALFVLLIALLMYKFGWSAGKRRERKKGLAPPQMAQSEYDPNEPAPFYTDNSNKGSGQPVPYRDSYMSGSTAFGSPTITMFAKQHQSMHTISPDGSGPTFAGIIPDGDVDPRQPSPAYSQQSYHAHSRTPSGANLSVVYEMDSTSRPQELATSLATSDAQRQDAGDSGPPLRHPSQQAGHSRGPSLDAPLASPGVVSDLEAGSQYESQYGSPFGSPRVPSSVFPHSGGYVSVPYVDPNGAVGRGQSPPPAGQEGQREYLPYNPGPR